MKLKNKIAIVTGAARGIGKACADRLQADGAVVVRADIVDGADLVHCDVSDKNSIDGLIARTAAGHGGIDILVNNAAISKACDVLDFTEADYDAIMNVNARGAFFMAQGVARVMVKQGRGGAIVNMSSVNAELAIPAIAAYCMSKGALKQMTAVMAIALAPHNIRVNAIGPGSVMTGMLNTVLNDKTAMNRILSRTPLGRIADPAEIASIAAFLAGDDASYITGQTIYADGGRMPLNYTVPVKQ